MCVEWLRDDLGIIEDAADSHRVAAACDDTGDVWFVPALLGLGTPVWDFGARGTFVGITRGTGRPEMVRAVLEGVAHRGADLLEAAEADTAMTIETLRIDGGMSANPTFVAALADAVGRPVEISPGHRGHHPRRRLSGRHRAGRVGRRGRRGGGRGARRPWSSPVPPRSSAASTRARWLAARARALATVPELSALEF